MNINQFKSSLNQRGMLHQTDFEVRIYPPGKLQAAGISTQEMTLRANGVDMPGRSIQTIPKRYAVGPEFNVGYNPSFVPVNMSLIADNRHFIKRFIEDWQDLVVGNFRVETNSPESKKYNLGYYKDYVGTVEIIQFDRDLKVPIYSCRLVECWPTVLNQTDLSWSTTDRTVDINVSWTYRYYENTDSFKRTNTSRDPQTASRPGQGLPASF
jgi:hypothetical protein